MLTWNWNGRLVSAGNMKVYTDDRIQVCRESDADANADSIVDAERHGHGHGQL